MRNSVIIQTPTSENASFITVISTEVTSILNNILRRHWNIYIQKIRPLLFPTFCLSPIPDSPDVFLNSPTAFPAHIIRAPASPSFLL